MVRFSTRRHHSTALARRLAVGAAIALLANACAAAPPAVAGRAWFLAPGGGRSGDGSASAPFRTFDAALRALRPGDTLLVRGGTYDERVTQTPLSPGTPDARITVAAYPGERPVLRGLLWLHNPSYWTLSGINVTWNAANNPSEHMVKMIDGTGWSYENSEIWGARSYAAFLVAGNPSGWTISHNFIHDTYPTHDVNQDHLIYCNCGTGGGTIERNILANSPNGLAVKLGGPRPDGPRIANVVVRYNTMVNNQGPSNVGLDGDVTANLVERNLMVNPAPRRATVTAFELVGSNRVINNLAWLANGVLEPSPGLINGGGNVQLDPNLDADFHPQAPGAQPYGRFAP